MLLDKDAMEGWVPAECFHVKDNYMNEGDLAGIVFGKIRYHALEN